MDLLVTVAVQRIDQKCPDRYHIVRGEFVDYLMDFRPSLRPVLPRNHWFPGADSTGRLVYRHSTWRVVSRRFSSSWFSRHPSL